MATTAAVFSRASTTRRLGGGPVGKPAASTHSDTTRPAGKAPLTEISPARARPSGAVHRARTQERPESSMAGGTAACSKTAGTGRHERAAHCSAAPRPRAGGSGRAHGPPRPDRPPPAGPPAGPARPPAPWALAAPGQRKGRMARGGGAPRPAPGRREPAATHARPTARPPGAPVLAAVAVGTGAPARNTAISKAARPAATLSVRRR